MQSNWHLNMMSRLFFFNGACFDRLNLIGSKHDRDTPFETQGLILRTPKFTFFFIFPMTCSP
jgi:hypothetical protein